jgi:hypothetical protein
MEVLRDFPKRGVCWNHNADLVSYLTKLPNIHINPNLQTYHTNPPKGVAWSEASCWGVSTASHNPPFHIEQLKPFLRPKFERVIPLTPDDCYAPVKFCLRITPDNAGLIKAYMSDHRDEYIGWLESWEPMNALGIYFCCPQQAKDCYAIPNPPKGYFQITNDAFLKHVLTKQKFPEKDSN